MFEEKIAALEHEMATCATDYQKLQTLSEEKETAEAALEAKMERWMELSELAETIAQNKQSLPNP